MNDLLEFVIKANLLQDSRTREVTEYLTKLKSATDAYSILQYRAYCCNLLQSLNLNMFSLISEDRQQLMAKCRNEISRCDYAMQQLGGKAVSDALLSQLTQPYGR